MHKIDKSFESPLTPVDARWQVIFGYELPPGMDYMQDSAGQKFIEFSDQGTYPTDLANSHALGGLVLRSTIARGVTYLHIPGNSVTLANALNEASGSSTVLNLPATRDMFMLMFEGLADHLRKGFEEGVLPTKLEYGQILVQKDSGDSKMLPPLSVRKFDQIDARKHWRNLISGFALGIEQGSVSSEQRNLLEKVIRPQIKRMERYAG